MSGKINELHPMEPAVGLDLIYVNVDKHLARLLNKKVCN